VLAEKSSDSLGVYRPRRSPHDGLPLLQLESLDDEEGDLSDVVLEPLDE